MISLSSLNMFCSDVESEPVEPKLFCVEPVPRLTISAPVPRLMVLLYNIICTVQYDRSLFISFFPPVTSYLFITVSVYILFPFPPISPTYLWYPSISSLHPY